MHVRRFLLPVYAFVDAQGNVRAEDFEMFESLGSVPQQWTATEAPSPHTLLRLKIALQAADTGALFRHLRKSSDPYSQGYTAHLTASQLEAITMPSDTAKTIIVSWLDKSGAQDIRAYDDWIHFSTTIAKADAMLNTKFMKYRHASAKGVEVIRALQIGLPRGIKRHVKMIHPTTRFSHLQQQSSNILTSDAVESQRLTGSEHERARPDLPCDQMVTPACLQDMYRIKALKFADASKIGRTGVAGFLQEYARFNDLQDFINSEAPWAKGANISWSPVSGGVLDQSFPGSSSEANLDVQYTLAISHPVPTHFYSTAGLGQLIVDLDQPDLSDNENEPYLEFFRHLLREDRPPHTITISYGENEQSVPPSYARTVCDMIAQLGARGTSVIISSGDVGPGSACQSNDGRNQTRFQAIFPASCPFATAVGGTVGMNPEQAANFSSGGFSDLWPRPWYQKQAVESYLKDIGQTWTGLYNPAGRGFPDVSAQAAKFIIRDRGEFRMIGGTSAAAPVFAGMIALLNAVRLQSGSPTLGFLNPWLYQAAKEAMTDITTGGSYGCSGRSLFSGLPGPKVQGAGWKAIKGWDAATGLGTPRFDRLIASLPVTPAHDRYPVPNTYRNAYV